MMLKEQREEGVPHFYYYNIIYLAIDQLYIAVFQITDLYYDVLLLRTLE